LENKITKKYPNKKIKSLSFFIVFFGVVFWLIYPEGDLVKPYSTVVEDKNGELLSATIASDGQWRFPPSDSIPYKFKTAIRLFEDEYFNYHPGFNPLSLLRAIRQNWQSEKVKSGGSTITMQLIRISRRKQRTYWQKAIEIILALKIEIQYSKKEIFSLYVANAPFGGNVVGLEAASWRYYGRSPHLLSWAEAATLAVLPNAPSLIYPGKNQIKLLKKRNFLLQKLYYKNYIDKTQYDLSTEEPLPQKPLRLPQNANHLLQFLSVGGNKGKRVVSTIKRELQLKVNEIGEQYYKQYSHEQIDNLAILVLDVKNAEVLAYMGNSNCPSSNCGGKVDLIQSKRSSGSTLKPFLYGFSIEEGQLFPNTLIKDVPTKIAEYQPENFDRKYDGAVTAKTALYRSLNVPSVRLLQDYGLEKFHSRLKYLGFKSINKGPDHYGLTLILGGAECTLWELCKAYYQLAKKANNEEIINLKTINGQEQSFIKYPFLSAESAFITAEMITETKRPLEQGAWKIFSSARKVAWKTGTSFGHRDAWAIGTTPEYVVGVWVGNADGEGRPGLTGVKKAAPVMFDVFRLLPETSWFKNPDKLVPIKTCKKSGFLPTSSCKETVTIMAPAMGIHQKSCPFHKIIQLDSTQKFRINSSCYPLHKSIDKSWFSLPVLEEWYYKRRHPEYKVLPPFLDECEESNDKIIDFIYPKGNTCVLIPKDLVGKKGRAVFHAVHKNETASLYWFLDNIFVGTTNGNHKIEISPEYEGKRKIIVVDNNGYRVEKNIFFIEK
jgi:penicillin-binding protein 1C